MSEEKSSFIKKPLYWFTAHPWLKLIALVLAIMVWFYIQGEISKYY